MKVIVGVLIFLLLLYLIIYSAVKNGIDQSEVGQLIKMKYKTKEEKMIVSNEEIEKELEREFEKSE
mgnify:FL=1